MNILYVFFFRVTEPIFVFCVRFSDSVELFTLQVKKNFHVALLFVSSLYPSAQE